MQTNNLKLIKNTLFVHSKLFLDQQQNVIRENCCYKKVEDYL